MHEKQLFRGVFAMTQAYCQPVLHSSTEQSGMHLAKRSAAAHWCWVTAQLYEEHIFIGVVEEEQACCQAVLQSSTEQ